MPVTSQTIYTASELVLIKESNSLLKECATQTHVWKPGDYSLHLRAVGEFLPCTSSHMIKMNPLFVNLPYMDAFTLGVIKDQRLVFSLIISFQVILLGICVLFYLNRAKSHL
ncbi:unnamed protein product [Brassica rapa subsp. narinosa]